MPSPCASPLPRVAPCHVSPLVASPLWHVLPLSCPPIATCRPSSCLCRVPHRYAPALHHMPPSLRHAFVTRCRPSSRVAAPCQASVAPHCYALPSPHPVALPLLRRPLSCIASVASCLHYVSPDTVTSFVVFLSLFHSLTAPFSHMYMGPASARPFVMCHCVALWPCITPCIAPWMDVGMCRCGHWVGIGVQGVVLGGMITVVLVNKTCIVL